MKTNHNRFLDLAFNIAQINLGKTKKNPSVGCVIVKKNSVISSGFTSLNGRPHAEYNALNKKKNLKFSDLYVTMEPCTHYGKTPPCTDLIKKKKIKRVIYSFIDKDQRTSNKAKKNLLKKKIKSKRISIKTYKDFYQSYFAIHNNTVPYADAKIAVSKDFFTINKKSRWITSDLSRKRTHLLRSQYDCVVSTSKSINTDNSLLNCRIEGFDKNKPDLIIIDLNLKLKKKLKLLNFNRKRKVFIVTKKNKNTKIDFFKKKGVKFIKIESLKTKNDFNFLLLELKKRNFNRIFFETGLNFLNSLMKNKILYNLFMFQSDKKLGKKGFNNVSSNFLKNKRKKKMINVNLNGDCLYRIKLK